MSHPILDRMEKARLDEYKLSSERPNGADIAEQLGYITYDWAMPQAWFDMVLNHVGYNPSGHIVWVYDWKIYGQEFKDHGGHPMPITPIGQYILSVVSLQPMFRGM